MRAVLVLASVVAALVPAPVLAQTRPPVAVGTPSTADECRFFVPQVPPFDVPPPDKPPSDGAPAPGASDEPFFGPVAVAAPPAGVAGLPRNVEIVLGGALVEVAQGFWDIELRGPDGAALPFVQDGARVVPVDGLLPPGRVSLTLSANATHPCQGCFAPGRQELDVIDVIDTTSPALTELVLHAFVPPSQEEQTRCNQFVGTGDLLLVAAIPDEPVFFTLAARHAQVAPRVLLQGGLLFGQQRSALGFNLAPDPVVAVGEDVIVAVALRDLAGNVAPPVVTRLRTRSLLTVDDPAMTVFDLPEQRCALDPAPAVQVPGRLPRNPMWRVVFPFEEQPLALMRGDEVVSLVPGVELVEDARAGRLFSLARPVDAGAWYLVGLPCERCFCPDCTARLRIPVTLEDVVDTTAPSAPALRGLIDDPSPPRSEGRCAPDRAATLAVLAPGDDDVAGPFDLVYDVVVQLGDDPPRPVGVGLPALRRANGDVVLRLPTAVLGRIVDEPMTVAIAARDGGGNVSQSTHALAGAADAASCAAAADAPPVLTLLAVLLTRRRRR